MELSVETVVLCECSNILYICIYLYIIYTDIYNIYTDIKYTSVYKYRYNYEIILFLYIQKYSSGCSPKELVN